MVCSSVHPRVLNSFINLEETLIEIHDDEYGYHKSVFLGMGYKIAIMCWKHGIFYQKVSHHLDGHGCSECGHEQLGKDRARVDFKEKSDSIHFGFYSYDKVNYINQYCKVIITCPYHGDFNQTAKHHLLGSGCPKCNVGGSCVDRPTKLYYLSINNGEAYKIGITTQTLANRYKNEFSNIKVLWTKNFKTGKDAFAEERKILKENYLFKYVGPDLLNGGNSELFNCDIFNLGE